MYYRDTTMVVNELAIAICPRGGERYVDSPEKQLRREEETPP
jgi:hypothetical protein